MKASFRLPGMPGAALKSFEDRAAFDHEIRPMIDRATTDLLIKPDQLLNMQIVDYFQRINSDPLRHECVAHLRRKLSSNKPKTVYMAVALAEAIVKQCGALVHASFGCDYSKNSFMAQMVKVATAYRGKKGAENLALLELVLDVVQVWGETFLVVRSSFPGFVQAYHDLRKAGMEFKPQCDPGRVPLIVHGGAVHVALAEPVPKPPRDDTTSSNKGTNQGPTPRKGDGDVPGGSKEGAAHRPTPAADYAQALATALRWLCDAVLRAESGKELRRDDTAADLCAQVGAVVAHLEQAVEDALAAEPDVAETLLALNDEWMAVRAAYEGVCSGSRTLLAAKDAVGGLAVMAMEVASAVPAECTGGRHEPPLLSLLDFDALETPTDDAAAAASSSSSSSSRFTGSGHGGNGIGELLSAPQVAAAAAAAVASPAPLSSTTAPLPFSPAPAPAPAPAPFSPPPSVAPAAPAPSSSGKGPVDLDALYASSPARVPVGMSFMPPPAAPGGYVAPFPAVYGAPGPVVGHYPAGGMAPVAGYGVPPMRESAQREMAPVAGYGVPPMMGAPPAPPQPRVMGMMQQPPPGQPQSQPQPQTQTQPQPQPQTMTRNPFDNFH